MNTTEEVEATEHKMPSTVTIAILCELFALLLSVSANLAAVWNDGTTARWIAAAIPIALIGGTYLLLSDRVPVIWWGQGWVAWYANFISAVGLLAPAAVASFWHQRHLLVASGTPDWLAYFLPLTVDGLALRAALTLFRHGDWREKIATTTESVAATPLQPKVSLLKIEKMADRPTEPATGPAASTVIPISKIVFPTFDRTGWPTATPDPSPTASDEPTASDVPTVASDLPAEEWERYEIARQLLNGNPRISKQSLADALGVTKYRAAQIKRDIEQEEVQTA